MKKVLCTTVIAAVFDLGAMDIANNMTMSSGTTTQATLSMAQLSEMLPFLDTQKYGELLDITSKLLEAEEDVKKNKKYRDKTVEELNKTAEEFNKIIEKYNKANEDEAANSTSEAPFIDQSKLIEALKNQIKADEDCNRAINLLSKKYNRLRFEVGSPIAFNEVCDKVSRKPNDSEKTAANHLKTLFDLGNEDEIHFMDAMSLIRGMGLETEKEQNFLNLLNAEKGEDTAYIGEYLYTECTFQDEVLKKEVLHNILKGCQKSKAYRNALIALIARTKMQKTFVSKAVFDLKKLMLPPFSTTFDKKLNFVRGEESASDCHNEIILSDIQYDKRSLHNSSSTTENFHDGLYDYPSDMSCTLFHEGGHSISAVFARFASEADTMEAISKLVTSRVNFKSMDFLKKLPQERQNFFKKNPKMAHILELESSRLLGADNAKILFSDACEVFQIMGLGVFRNDGKKILCINMLSDFALSLELGLPIRWGHGTAHNYGDTIKYSKTPAYDALFPLFGSSIEEYESRLNAEKECSGCWNTAKRCWNWLSSPFRKKQ